MRALAVACLLVAVLTPSPASAQQWSPEQQEVIDSIKACWDIWMDALEADDPDIFFDACDVGGTTYWWTMHNAPTTPETDRRNWDRYRDTDTGWSDMRPVSVTVFGSVAVVHLYGYWLANTATGEVVTEQMRTEFWQKRDGRWLFLGGQGTPVTEADAAPYR